MLQGERTRAKDEGEEGVGEMEREGRGSRRERRGRGPGRAVIVLERDLVRVGDESGATVAGAGVPLFEAEELQLGLDLVHKARHFG